MKAFWLAGLCLIGLTGSGFCAGYDDLNTGIAAYNRGDWLQTLTYLDKALASGELNADQQYVARLDRARARANRVDYDGALADAAAILVVKPGDKEATALQLALHVDSGKLDDARLDADALVAANPKDPTAYNMRASLDEMSGDPAKELADLQAVQTYTPDYKNLTLHLGIANFESGKLDAAAGFFEKVRSDNPVYGWVWLALTDVRLHKPIPAAPAHSGAPAWPDALIDVFEGRGSEDTALAAAGADLRGAVGRVCEANFYLGEWRLAHGDATGAHALLQEAASLCPKAYNEWFAAKGALHAGP